MTETGHVVDSSDHQQKISPELAALDAAMRAGTDAQWYLAGHAHKPETRAAERAKILDEALRLAMPVIAAAVAAGERERLLAEIDPAKLDQLADWINTDLRRFADLLRAPGA